VRNRVNVEVKVKPDGTFLRIQLMGIRTGQGGPGLYHPPGEFNYPLYRWMVLNGTGKTQPTPTLPYQTCPILIDIFWGNHNGTGGSKPPLFKQARVAPICTN